MAFPVPSASSPAWSLGPCLILWAFLFQAVASPEPGNLFPEKTRERIKELTELAYHDHLLEALSGFEAILAAYPDNPVGYFYVLATLEKIQTDYMSDYREDDLVALLKDGMRVADQYTRQHGRNPLSYFFEGAIQGYYGLHYYRVENRLSVFTTGLKAVGNLRRAVDMKPDLWDAYYGLGIYYYYKSQKAPFLYLLGIGRQEDKNKGIHYLTLAATRGVYGAGEARGALVRVLQSDDRFEEALHWLHPQVQQYPTSAHNRRMRLRAYVGLERWREALAESLVLEDLLSKKPFTGPGAMLQVKYYRALSEYHLGNKAEAKRLIEECLHHYDRAPIFFDRDLARESRRLYREIQSTR